MTSDPGYSHLAFGTSPAFDDSIATPISALITSHSLTVPRRKPGRLYYFRAATTNAAGTSFSATYPVVTTSSQSSGQIDVYFNYSVDGTLGLLPTANGNVDLRTKLLERISHATKSIDLALYSFDDFNSSVEAVASRVADSLIAAKNRGVAVRMVFEDKQTSSSLAKLIAAGIPVQKRNLANNNGIMHNKFFIFDGRDTTSAADDWVMSGSWNVTDIGTYLDAQNVVFIQDQSLSRIYTLEFEEMFGSSGETANPNLARFGPTKQDNTPHYTIINGARVEVYFSPSDQTTSRIIQALSTANSNIFFGLLTFTRDDIREQLIASKNAGVVVRGMIDQEPSELGTLQSAGVDAMQAGHSAVTGLFHHKYGIVDPFSDASDPLVITGSHNWSTAAEVDNDENTLIIHSGIIARQYVQEFSKRYKESGGSGTITGVKEQKSDMPASYELSQNHPNPFNPSTTIEYQIPPSPFLEKGERGGFVSLKVYDLLGREVAILVDEIKPAGTYTLTWNASQVSSGVYFYRLQSQNTILTRKMLILK
jgi:phosphatidylserine/phosphatidylglycerophosphate/cardiolipin synthase-like enzyme